MREGGREGREREREREREGDLTSACLPTPGEPPLIKVMREENQFQIRHCQNTLSVLYDANGWVKRAREHPSFRIVAQVMADSKK